MEVTGVAGSGGYEIKGGDIKKAMDKEAFLKLLITQLENQDPLDPVDDTEFVAQLAQFTALEGINNLNDTMETVSTHIASMNDLSTSALIGRTVTAMGSEFHYTGQPVSLGYELDEYAARLTITVRDNLGRVVRTVEQEGVLSGSHTFIWDGKDNNGIDLPQGRYTFTVSGTNRDNSQVDVTTYVTGKVSGVSYEGGDTYLLLGDVRILPDTIKEIY